MRKKTIVILFILSILITVGATVIAIATGALASSSQSCYDAYDSCSTYSPGATTALSLSFLLAVVMYIAASVLQLIAWIGALVKQGKQEQWGWFVCTLLFGSICLLIYLIAVPETPQYMLPTYAPGYQPLQPPMYTPPTQYPSPYHQPQPYQPPTSDPWRPY